MTVNGTVWATAALLVLVVAAGAYGWNSVDATAESVSLPGWIFPVVLGALGVAILTIFKPNLARFTAPLYALLEGAFLGAISGLYNAAYDGIVMQAVGLTIGVFAVMLFLYGTRIIKVTEKLRMGIVAATGAIFLVYMVNMVLSLFDAEVPFLHDTGPLGIGISLLIVGVAAFNLLLDFDFIERGVAAGAPKQDGVVRRLRPARHHRVALPGAPAPPGQAPGPGLTPEVNGGCPRGEREGLLSRPCAFGCCPPTTSSSPSSTRRPRNASECARRLRDIIASDATDRARGHQRVRAPG